jgi:prolyl-tRNA synthetase
MPDGKALQACTSHNLGQNFSKAFDISFQTKEGNKEFVHQTSWGFSTRSMGGLFLTHGDDQGLILPPKIAPIQVVVMPIPKKGEDNDLLTAYCQDLREMLQNGGIRTKFDKREEPSVGRRFNEWEVKGVPLRYEVGTKEVKERTVTIARRDTGEKKTVERSAVLVETEHMLDRMQKDLFDKALTFQKQHTSVVSTYEEFKQVMETKRGFIQAFWCEEASCEAKIFQYRRFYLD